MLIVINKPRRKLLRRVFYSSVSCLSQMMILQKEKYGAEPNMEHFALYFDNEHTIIIEGKSLTNQCFINIICIYREYNCLNEEERFF